jgi:hypothetical protein
MDYSCLLYETIDLAGVASLIAAPGAEIEEYNNGTVVSFEMTPHGAADVIRRGNWWHDDFGVQWGCMFDFETSLDDTLHYIQAVHKLTRTIKRGALLNDYNIIFAWENDTFYFNTKEDSEGEGGYHDMLSKASGGLPDYTIEWRDKEEFWDGGVFTSEDPDRLSALALQRLQEENTPTLQFTATSQPLNHTAARDTALAYERRLHWYDHNPQVADTRTVVAPLLLATLTGQLTHKLTTPTNLPKRQTVINRDLEPIETAYLNTITDEPG